MSEFRYFLDSNIFLRPIVKDNPEKVRDCEGLFEKLKKGEIKALTSNLILAEIIWVGNSFYKIEKKDLVGMIRGILDFKNLKIIDSFDSRKAMEFYEKYPVKFIDALIASNPKIFKKEITIISYDKDFDKLDVKRKEPKEVLEGYRFESRRWHKVMDP